MMKPPTRKQLKNEEALLIYAFILSGLILFTVIVRYGRRLCSKISPSSSGPHEPEHVSRAILPIFYKLESRMAWKPFGQPSLGLVILTSTYIIITMTLSSTHLALYRVNHFASRFGWLAAANMALCVFFRLKISPLTLLTGVSHSQLNMLHRIVGYFTVACVSVHAVLYTVHFARKGHWEALLEAGNIQGLGAGVAMLILLMGIFRHARYKLFYASHIAGFVGATILTGLHRPDWAAKLPIVMLLVACIWLLDRVIRGTRLLCNLANNRATFHPLADGGTRLLLKKPAATGAVPGSHCYLWIPHISFHEVHPFTVVDNTPNGLELVIKTHKGFTKSLNELAQRHPGKTTWAAIDGPYGLLPDTAAYSKLVLIAGGSGAAFTFGLMNRIRDHSPGIKLQSIDFVWAVKRTVHLTWFSEHIYNLAKTAPTVNIIVFITSEDGTGSDILHGFPQSNAWDGIRGLITVKHEKMNADKVILDSMQAVEKHQQVLVAACGPSSLMDAVKDSAHSWRTRGSCGLDVHCEDFDD
ncbi:hypothetical protein B0I35DRAFT_488926 [Stachybotrys elegans]|uniref:ferric-chelate reductase (NADPH) n=1 Tax=Stachybotrys elegans TaxID=80388 RepID=A0A8K0SLJ4_9HYPO|nr:hypothetical protein B0I35DRAFT_488926 [Stachybotrys elegans]